MDRKRDKKFSSAAPLATGKQNQWFLPREGIERDVITADIQRYLGQDALVRPGSVQDPETGIVRQGYIITAYRNLTTAMIADLKADSQRWQDERASREGQSEYQESMVHRSRQHWGPSPDDSATYPQYQEPYQQQPISGNQLFDDYSSNYTTTNPNPGPTNPNPTRYNPVPAGELRVAEPRTTYDQSQQTGYNTYYSGTGQATQSGTYQQSSYPSEYQQQGQSTQQPPYYGEYQQQTYQQQPTQPARDATKSSKDKQRHRH